MITAHPHMIHTRELITAATHTLLQKATSPVTPTGILGWHHHGLINNNNNNNNNNKATS